jgi:hypothetical protein
MNKVSLGFFLCSNTGSIRNDSYWTSSRNSLELIELSSMNKVSLFMFPAVRCSDTGRIKVLYTSREKS